MPAPLSDAEFQRLREGGLTPMQLPVAREETDWDGVSVVDAEFTSK
jgi:hypothetical protein